MKGRKKQRPIPCLWRSDRIGRYWSRTRLALFADRDEPTGVRHVEALSELAGLHRTYVGLLERGLRMPSILVAKKVAGALGVTTAELIAEVERE